MFVLKPVFYIIRGIWRYTTLSCGSARSDVGNKLSMSFLGVQATFFYKHYTSLCHLLLESRGFSQTLKSYAQKYVDSGGLFVGHTIASRKPVKPAAHHAQWV